NATARSRVSGCMKPIDAPPSTQSIVTPASWSICASSSACTRRREKVWVIMDRSTSERVRPDLELDDLSFRALPALDVPDEVRAVVRVQATPLPSGAGIVDAAVHAARVEAEGIRHPQRDPLARLRIQREQRVGIRPVR